MVCYWLLRHIIGFFLKKKKHFGRFFIPDRFERIFFTGLFSSRGCPSTYSLNEVNGIPRQRPKVQEATPELPGQPPKHTYRTVKTSIVIRWHCLCTEVGGGRQTYLFHPQPTFLYSADAWCQDTWIWDNDRGQSWIWEFSFYIPQQVDVMINLQGKGGR